MITLPPLDAEQLAKIAKLRSGAEESLVLADAAEDRGEAWEARRESRHAAACYARIAVYFMYRDPKTAGEAFQASERAYRRGMSFARAGSMAMRRRWMADHVAAGTVPSPRPGWTGMNEDLL